MCAIVPQIILRPTAGTEASFQIFLPVFFGFVVFAISMAVLHQLNLVVPRKSARKVVNDYLGVSMGIAVGAAQILAFAMLVLIGVEVIIGALRFVLPIGDFKAVFTAVLVFIFALISLYGSPIFAPKIIRWFAIVTMIFIMFVIFVALVMEALGAGIFSVAIPHSYRLITVDNYDWRAQIESFLAACLPAAAIILLGERVLVTPELRRVRLKQNLRGFVPVLLAIAFTLYISVVLFRPYQLNVVPIMAIAILILPAWAWHLMLVALILVGFSLAISAYWQLPRIMREMALEGILPRKLGVQDSVNARRFIVLAIALLASFATFFISSARSLAMVFILATYLTALVTCSAMIARSQSILRISLDAVKRREAKRLRWIFLGYSLFLLCISASFLMISVKWVLWTIFLLAGPVCVLGIYSFGRGRRNRALNVSDFLENRMIPTKVHGVVLISQLNEVELKAVEWAKALRFASTQGICVDIDQMRTKQLREDWVAAKIPFSLTILGTPAGALRGPVIEFVRSFRDLHPNEPLTVVVPRVIGASVLAQLFAKFYTPSIVSELRREMGVMILEVPYLVGMHHDDD